MGLSSGGRKQSGITALVGNFHAGVITRQSRNRSVVYVTTLKSLCRQHLPSNFQ